MNRATIDRLVRASGVTAGELILIHFWGENGEKHFADEFAAAVAALGASPVLVQQSRTANQRIFHAADERAFDTRYFALFSSFDAVLDIFAYQPVVLGEPLEDAAMERYRRYMRALFGKLMTCRRFTQLRLPTAANAAESGLAAPEFIARMERAYDIDYDALAASCEHEAERWRDAERVVLRTGESCALTLTLRGREWQTDAGDGDLPCGEVYIAPVETETNGSVYFDTLYLDGAPCKAVTLYVENGLVCGSNNAAAAAYFAALNAPERTVCELGIGLNPNVTDLCGYTVLDEKMRGTFHIAVGANDMFGGENHASDHRDLVGHGKLEVLLR